MIRFWIALVLLAASSVARAQPAPRVVFDVVLPTADGFKMNSYVLPGALAVGTDGVHYVLLTQVLPGEKERDPARDARVELLVVAPDGAIKTRRALPIREKIEDDGWSPRSLGVIATRSGDVAVFVCFEAKDGQPSPPPAAPGGRVVATLLRLAADGSVKKATPIGPPSREPQPGSDYYQLGVYEPTPDNAILVAGGYGGGPYAWWMGKFSLDGARVWQGGPGLGGEALEKVAAVGWRPDGSLVNFAVERRPKDGGGDWFIRRNMADGKLLAHTRLPQSLQDSISTIAVLRDRSALILRSDERRKGELVFVDDGGRIQRRMPWSLETFGMIADGDGFAAIVEGRAGSPDLTFVVRVDARGEIRWRSTLARYGEIVRAPDGQIVALVNPESSGGPMRLMRFADP